MSEETGKNEYLDKLTMELFLNKNHYAKYLKNTDPKRHDEYQAFTKKLKKHAIDIVDITSALIENPKDAPTIDIEESFDSYVKSIIRHLEIKDLENPKEEQYKEDDEDVLFGQMDERPSPSQSFWSKERVVKSQYDSDIRAFSSSRR